MKITNCFKKTLCLILALLLINTTITPAFADEIIEKKEVKVISIKTAKDLVELSNNCKLDTYSNNIKVILENNIDLEGSDFEPIPIFNGEFDGNGYEIKGLKIQDEGSKKGLFRYVKKDAYIKNFKITAYIKPEGTKSDIGIIAGINEGRIYKIEVSGEVQGDTNVGSIVGINTATGIVSSCTSKAFVIGDTNVGGMVGTNKGLISKCANYGEVNTVEEGYATSNKIDLDTDDITMEYVEENINQEISIFTNVGGISGRNSGKIENCTNDSNIGYNHLGSNIGGISGTQKGIIKDCINKGEIFGRKNIGGIVGQFEPVMTINYSENPNDKLNEEIHNLSDIMKKLNKEAKKSTDNIFINMDKITNASDSIKDKIQVNGNKLSDKNDTVIDEIYEKSQKINSDNKETIDELKLVTENTNKNVTKINTDIKDITDVVDGYYKDIDKKLVKMKETIKENTDEIEKQRKVTEYIEDYEEWVHEEFGELKDKIDKQNSKINGSKNKIKSISEGLIYKLISFENNVKELNAAIAAGKVTPELMGAVIKTLNDLTGNATSLAEMLSESQKISNALSVITYDVRDSLERTNNKTYSLSLDIQKARDKVLDSVENISDSLYDTTSEVMDKTSETEEKLKTYSDSILNTNEEIIADIKKFTDKANETLANDSESIDYIEDTLNVHADFISDNLDDTTDVMYEELDNINSSLRNMHDNGVTNTTAMNNTLNSAITQMSVISDVLKEMLTPPEYEEKDVSDIDIEKERAGQIDNSKNYSTVTGDSNVGGIAGVVSKERNDNEEDEYKYNEHFLSDVTTLFRSVIMYCENTGKVNAKKGFVGGLVGRTDVGLIYKSSNDAIITIDEENYAGGIAGLSKSKIYESYASSKIICNDKNDNIGGIAGYSKEIKNCLSMFEVENEGEKIGAITGSYDEEDGIIKDNKFVMNGIGGIDNISYETMAKPYKYADFIKMDVPKLFSDVNIKFIANGKLIKEIHIKYDGDVSKEEIPKVPEVEGKYGNWEEFKKENIERNIVVKAIYSPMISTIASEIDEENTIPLILADARFSDRTSIKAEKIEYKGAIDAGYKYLNSYSINIVDLKSKLDDVIKYRLNVNGEKNAKVALITENGLEMLDSKIDGTYIVFEAPRHSEVVILQKEDFKIIYILLIVIIIVAAVVYLKKRKPKLKKIKKENKK